MPLPYSSPPTAKGLIQSLLLAAEGEAFPSRQLVAAGALFGISENNIRVALVRLQGEGLAEVSGRGCYTLGQGARGLGQAISAWRHVEARMVPWQGQYVGVHVAALARSDRTALARRERALQMLGFREVSKGLLMRPDNLEGGVCGCRDRLLQLGADATSLVFGMHAPCEQITGQLGALWSVAQLNQLYRQTCDRLQRWLDTHHQLPPDQAAREAYLLDKVAVRQVVWDPLLPDEWVDANARREMFALTRAFDAAGRDIWTRFFRYSDGD